MMLSNVFAGRDEAWDLVDELPPTPCSHMRYYAAAVESRTSAERALPLYLHACQWYTACPGGEAPPCLGVAEATGAPLGWHFHKGHVPHDLFSCDRPLLARPPEGLFNAQTSQPARRAAFMVCALTAAYNAAAEAGCSANRTRQACVRIARGVDRGSARPNAMYVPAC